MATVPTAEPKAAAAKLNVYLVQFVTRSSPGAPAVHKQLAIVAHTDVEAGAWVMRNAVLHPKQLNKDIQGLEQVVVPAQSSVEVLSMRTLQQDVEVAG